jgi:hypothetical protein
MNMIKKTFEGTLESRHQEPSPQVEVVTGDTVAYELV